MKSTVSPAPDAPNNPLLAALIAAQQRHTLFPLGDAPTPVVVAVSGGVDSVCLLHVLTRLADVWRLQLHVAHLDHALRPESVDEAALVAQLAARWRLPLHTDRLSPNVLVAQPDGLENAARRARYAFLARVAINVTPPGKVPQIALAHHADDQAETLLLHLTRGSGLAGLVGMRPVTPLTEGGDTVQLVRPLLGVRRQEILRYAATHDLPWCEDVSNQDLHFARNRLRHRVLPELRAINPGVVESLNRTAEILVAEAQRSEQINRQALQALLLTPLIEEVGSTSKPPERLVLSLDGLLALDQATQRGVTRQALLYLEPAWPDLGFAEVESLLEWLRCRGNASGPHPLSGEVAWSVAGATAATPARLSLHRVGALPFAADHPYLDAAWRQQIGVCPLPQSGQVRVGGDWLLQVDLIAPDQLPPDWRSREHPWRAFLDADQVGAPVLTVPRLGLRFAPLGMGGQEKSLGDFFTDRKTPSALRSGWPILLDQERKSVLWVCGLATAHGVRITEATQRVLRLEWLRATNGHAR